MYESELVVASHKIVSMRAGVELDKGEGFPFEALDLLLAVNLRRWKSARGVRAGFCLFALPFI